jgi:hypothetical protein
MNECCDRIISEDAESQSRHFAKVDPKSRGKLSTFSIVSASDGDRWIRVSLDIALSAEIAVGLL